MPGESRLAQIASSEKIQNYSQGAAQNSVDPLAEFTAPTVEVTRHTGRFKKYDEKNRFSLPNTFRGIGGIATRLQLTRDDASFNCDPHAIDQGYDDIEIQEAEMEDVLMEAADENAAIGSLAHANDVITQALAGAGAATGGAWKTDTNNPVKEIWAACLEVLLAVPLANNAEIGVVFGPTTWMDFFSNAKTQAYFPGKDLIAPTEENFRKLLPFNITPMISMAVKDTAAKGKAASFDWLLDNKTLVFARAKTPTKRDPSFMKTFRPRNRWMVPSTTRLPDDRGELVKLDWSADVQVTNAAAGKLFTNS